MIDPNHFRNLAVRRRASCFIAVFLLAGLLATNASAQTFKTLHSFPPTKFGSVASTNSDGARPVAGLILSGNTLYGTASLGGTNGNGTVFAVNTDGTDFTNLHNFTAKNTTNSVGVYTNSDGNSPTAGLILLGNTLYGTASSGGSSGKGTVFSLSTNGTGFTTLYDFAGENEGA